MTTTTERTLLWTCILQQLLFLEFHSFGSTLRGHRLVQTALCHSTNALTDNSSLFTQLAFGLYSFRRSPTSPDCFVKVPFCGLRPNVQLPATSDRQAGGYRVFASKRGNAAKVSIPLPPTAHVRVRHVLRRYHRLSAGTIERSLPRRYERIS